MELIHIMRGQDSFGPYTKEQVYEYLNQGILLPGDLAWHEGLEGWIPLEQFIAATAPTIEAHHPAQMPQHTMPSAPEVYAAGVSLAPAESKGKSKLAIAIVAGLLVLGGLVTGGWYFFFNQTSKGINQTSKVAIGTPIWQFETEDEVRSSPAIGSDGTVYVGSGDNKLYAINGNNGSKLWEFEMRDEVRSSPTIGSDGTVYFGSNDKKLYAINGKTGSKLWEFETGDDVGSSPAIGSDGTVYVGSGDKKLYAINGKTGVKLWEFETGSYVTSSPVIGSDGAVYVGSDDDKLYAIKTDSKGPAKSPWPMFGQNARQTGRVMK